MTLMEFLLENRDNRSVLAVLRQGLSPATETRAWPLLARFGGIGQTPEASAVRTVAALFARHPENCVTGNMGDTCRRLCRGTDEHPWDTVDGEGEAVPPGPVGRRFSWLLAADADDICGRVARVVLHAGRRGIPVNYAQLEKDLTLWPDQRVREAWAGAFWAPKKGRKADEEPAP